MITITDGFRGVTVTEMSGLSTDTKPKDVVNASTFYEMDTGKVYVFNAQNKVWIEQTTLWG